MSKFQSISLPTLSDSATMKEVENESRKMGLDILNKLNAVADAQYPVGYVYTQYSGQTAPALLFGGTWTDITATSLPTQVYDSGSNANGSWIRYTDGTMMCWGNYSWTFPAMAINTGAVTPSISMASQTFVSQANITVTIKVGYGEFLSYKISEGGTDLTSFVIVFLNNASTPTFSGPGFVEWQAIGKWSSAPVYPVTLWKRTGGSLNQATGTSVVTGIYDSGTNSNGSWIRFTDGTMMCWGSNSVTGLAITSALVGGFRSGANTVTFPVAFIDTSYSTVANTDNIASFAAFASFSSTSTFVMFYTAVTSTASANVSSRWQATGKWK